MREIIKESCSCGAILEYEESFDQSWESHSSYRQDSFHKAHKKCRSTHPVEEEKKT